MNNHLSDSVDIDEEESGDNKGLIFVQKFINKAVKLWPWLLVSLTLCISLAFVYYKLGVPIYTTTASILVQDDKKGTDFGDANLLSDFGLLLNKSSVDNEMEIFKSRSLMTQVVRELQLNIRYFVEGKLQQKEIYGARPLSFYLLELPARMQTPPEYVITVNRLDKTFKLSYEDKVIKGRLGDTLQLHVGKVILNAESGLARWNAEMPFSVRVGGLDATVKRYMSLLKVTVPNKLVSVIDIGINDALPEKGEVIVNALINAYLQANVNDKNRMADSTVKFIDERLKLVFGELSGIEHEIENFKTVNKITDVSEQARLLLDNTSEFGKQKTAQEVQLAVVNELESFLKNNLNDARTVPSSLVMQDPNFVSLVSQYNQLQLERDKRLMSQTVEHPAVKTLDDQLKNLRLDLLSSIASIKKGIQVSIAELQKRTSAFEGLITKVPAKERVFLDYSRQQAIKQELYLFLLKKREETAISKSSTIANARIVDMAKADTTPISPVKKRILMMGLILGLIIPFAISYGRDFLNNKISSQEDIVAYTNVPILSEIGHNEEESVIAINATSRTVIAEQFRALRTNLQYVLTGDEKKLILITSSMSGEGKSFLSINLCSSLGLAGKKVILLELDLRRPRISEDLRLQKSGFTNFIVGKDLNWQQWIQQSAIQDNFDVLSSGPLPPNPSELLMLPKVGELFNELKKHYDYIVVDSAPIGLVTDAQVIAPYADLTLYVVRHHFTFKQQLKMVEKLFVKKTLPKMNLIVNDIMMEKPVYGYGYGYDFYLYGYDSNDGAANGKKTRKETRKKDK